MDPFTLLMLLGAASGIKMVFGSNESKSSQRELDAQRFPVTQDLNAPPVEVEPMKRLDLLHGTSRENALNMLHERAFKVGDGAAHGRGIYLTKSVKTAREYAKKKGAIVTVTLELPASQIAQYHEVKGNSEFKQWRKGKRFKEDGDAISAYCLDCLGKRFLQLDDEIIVVLSPRKTEEDERMLVQGVYVTGALDYHGNPLN